MHVLGRWDNSIAERAPDGRWDGGSHATGLRNKTYADEGRGWEQKKQKTLLTVTAFNWKGDPSTLTI